MLQRELKIQAAGRVKYQPQLLFVSFLFLQRCDFSVCVFFVAPVGFCSAGFLFLQKSGAKESTDGKSAQLEGGKNKSCAGLD